MKIIQQGAEAIISLKDNQIIKNRVFKSYRIQELNNKLITRRTKSEAKIIEKLKNIIPVPKIISINKENNQIVMEYINGKKLSETLESLDYKKICKQIAETITKMHDFGVIHGDLTTSNMIFKDEKVYFIDFGLGFHSNKIEDKAVDLHLIQQALNAKHFSISEICFNTILNNYKPKEYKKIIQRIKVIESRGRYKDKF
jgi:Kae1-associated kinase Bud32